MRRSRLQIAKPWIETFFDNQRKRVYTLSELGEILEDYRSEWILPRRLTFNKFLDFLEEETRFVSFELDFASGTEGLFTWGEASLLEMAMTLRPRGYLSHYSAMYCHGLTSDERMQFVYINVEQSKKKGSKGSLEQGRIDAAFKRPLRLTSNSAEVGDATFYLLNGKNTGRLGVIEEDIDWLPIPLRLTSLERTLIDAVVRPGYARGSLSVAEAYKRAAGEVSVVGMLDMLRQLDYVYPYHQAIGFYLDYSQSYDERDIEVFYNIPRLYDFYLDYQMANPKYSEKWRVYYPSDM